MLMTATIDPTFDVDYCGYVVGGFRRLLGRQNVHFSPLRELSSVDPHRFILRAKIEYGRRTKLVVIDLRDHSDVRGGLLQIVDSYGKTNLRAVDTTDRCFAIGPTFGVASSRLAQLGAFLGNGGTTANRLSQRATLKAYRAVPGRDDYVFFLAWPWSKHAEVNADRASFVKSMQELRGVTFEGGFVPLGRLNRKRAAPGLEELTAGRQYRHGAYLRRLRLSAFAVNTPAVHDCLGWKLGEYFALGKAVISLPLTRVMPGHLEHGEQMHFIHDTAEATSAMRRLIDDRAYRRHLEQGARKYWESYLDPSVLVRRVIAHAFADEALPAVLIGQSYEEFDDRRALS